MDPRLNWVPRFDPRSRAYPVRALIPVPPKRRNKTWRLGPILDQGQEGRCVGMGWAAEALATPVAVRLKWVAQDIPREPLDFADFVYRSAKLVDEWEGENYDGTSVLAGAKAMESLGLVKEYRWAFSLEDVIDTVLDKGPVVVGTSWYEGMYDPVGGVLRVTGDVVGGHCYLVVGYRVAPPETGGEDALVIQNSWGTDWGTGGTALVTLSDMRTLLTDGEAAVVTRRSYGWKMYGARRIALSLLGK